MTHPTIPFYLHDLGEKELARIADVFRGPILTTGAFVNEFEEKFASWLGVRHTVAYSSWTGAAHMTLTAHGIRPGDEVITTPLTFIASATAIIQAGATPVFADVDPETGNLDPAAAAAVLTPRTRGILPVHLYGQMCDIVALRRIADRHDLFLLEDAAHCVEGVRDGYRPGHLGNAACFSFFATKNLACGEGGAAVTNDPQLAEKLRLLRTHGMTKTSADREREGYQHWDMVCMGWKYNLDNIHAAILLSQFEDLDQRWQRRDYLARLYFEHLQDTPGLSWPTRLPSIHHANHLFTVHVPPAIRDEVISGLAARGISAVVNYRAIHLLTYFRETFGFTRGMFPNAERIGDSTITLPLYCKLSDRDVVFIAAALRDVLAHLLT